MVYLISLQGLHPNEVLQYYMPEDIMPHILLLAADKMHRISFHEVQDFDKEYPE